MLQQEQKRHSPERPTDIPQRAMNLRVFCARYGIGRTSAYSEIKQGRLRAKKVGRKTIVCEDDAERWLRLLPVLETGPVP
jgi:hypothetical protein